MSQQNEQPTGAPGIARREKWEELVGNDAELKQSADELADALRRYKSIERRIAEETK